MKLIYAAIYILFIPLVALYGLLVSAIAITGTTIVMVVYEVYSIFSNSEQGTTQSSTDEFVQPFDEDDHI